MPALREEDAGKMPAVRKELLKEDQTSTPQTSTPQASSLKPQASGLVFPCPRMRRPVHFHEFFNRKVSISLGGGKTLVPQQFLNDA